MRSISSSSEENATIEATADCDSLRWTSLGAVCDLRSRLNIPFAASKQSLNAITSAHVRFCPSVGQSDRRSIRSSSEIRADSGRGRPPGLPDCGLALSASYSRAEAGFLLHLRTVVEVDVPKKFGSNLGPKPWSDGPKNGVSEQQGQQIQRDFGGSVWESNPNSQILSLGE